MFWRVSMRFSSGGCVLKRLAMTRRAESGATMNSDEVVGETFIGMRAGIDNWRWSGVPFFLRTGKRLGEQRRLLTIAFREPPRRMFREARAFVEDYGPDHISFDLGDPGGITTRFLAKVPGPRMRLGQARMEFSYQSSFGAIDCS